jgi:hypothetical protein
MTAAGNPMTIHELVAHPSVRPLDLTTRSMGQILKYLVASGKVKKAGRGPKKATYRVAGPKADPHKRATAMQAVLVRFNLDGTIHSIVPPEGIPVAFEFVK